MDIKKVSFHSSSPQPLHHRYIPDSTSVIYHQQLEGYGQKQVISREMSVDELLGSLRRQIELKTIALSKATEYISILQQQIQSLSISLSTPSNPLPKSITNLHSHHNHIFVSNQKRLIKFIQKQIGKFQCKIAQIIQLCRFELLEMEGGYGFGCAFEGDTLSETTRSEGGRLGGRIRRVLQTLQQVRSMGEELGSISREWQKVIEDVGCESWALVQDTLKQLISQNCQMMQVMNEMACVIRNRIG